MLRINRLRMSFGASGAQGGIISNGVGYFLLLYYSQVLGLDPALAGLAMMISMIVDAISDPLIGRWSDVFSHKLGRRHPFLFASVLPIPILYFLLWDVPELDQTGLFFYLLIVTILLRLSITLHSIPFNSLLPELTSDYDERTKLTTTRIASAWFSGCLVSVLMYGWWLADSAEYPDGSGIMRAEGYVAAGGTTAVVIFLCLGFAAFSTRRYIPELSRPKLTGTSVKDSLRQMRKTLVERNLLAIFVCGLFGAVATGTYNSLWPYMQSFFWNFDTQQLSILMASQVIAAVMAFSLMPLLTRQREKKGVYLLLSVVSALVVTAPVFLRNIDFFPSSQSELLFPLMLLMGVVEVMLFIMTSALLVSMMADVTDHRAVETGLREEGLLFSVESFISKVSAGVGVWIGGLILSAVSFPREANSTDIDTLVLIDLGWIYAILLLIVYGLSILGLLAFRLNRSAHSQNISSLDADATDFHNLAKPSHRS